MEEAPKKNAPSARGFSANIDPGVNLPLVVKASIGPSLAAESPSTDGGGLLCSIGTNTTVMLNRRIFITNNAKSRAYGMRNAPGQLDILQTRNFAAKAAKAIARKRTRIAKKTKKRAERKRGNKKLLFYSFYVC